MSLGAASQMARFFPVQIADLAHYGIAALLLFAGFYGMARLFVADLRPLSAVGFVRRPGIGGEFARGAALGWGIAIALVLPALLTGNLHMSFTFDLASVVRTAISVAMLLAFALVLQLILAGLPVQMLLKATSAAWACAAVVFVVVMLAITGSASEGRTLLVMVAMAILFLMGFLRTRAIWFSLGLHAAWLLALLVLFGAPSSYAPPAFGIVQSETDGPGWLTGGLFGPDASLFTVVVLLVALVVAYRMTKDYAWHYTWQPLEGAGYPMDVPPPAEHLRQEQKQTAPLVQIGGLTSTTPVSHTEE